ncbi:MAG: methyltransferase domain-containing protein [Proteobacteria bacterium]|nr:methyltransferase domain-containing protein [Pseudomonadota bacterium]
MATVDTKFVGSIPEIYDSQLVPLIFEPYAADMARRLQSIAPKRILEIAAGTGAVTRAVAAALPAAEIVATDLNGPMIERARSRQNDSRIEWRTADALALPFADADFDAVVCQFGAMFFPDKVKGYSEARRVLKPGGTYLFSVWDRIETNEPVNTAVNALANIFPQDPPRFMQRTPHGYYDHDVIRREVNAAGFTNVTIDTVDAVARAASARAAVHAYFEGSPLKPEIETRGAPGMQAAIVHATEAVEKKYGTGPIEGNIRAFVVTARK